MLIDAENIKESTEFEADICIVGGGVAGTVLTKELLSSGKQIILLESGNEFYSPSAQELYKANKIPKYFDNPFFSRMSMLGGSSNHWENSTERFDPIDFEKRSWVANSGWPISYNDVEPYYSKAGEYCNVGTEAYDKKTWGEIKPFEDIFHSSNKLNTSFLRAAVTSTRFYQKHLKEHVNHKNLKLFVNAPLIDLNLNNNGEIKKAFIKPRTQITHQIKAKVFVLCMGGIENTRLLLNLNEKYSNNLGNQYGNVGKFFMEHPTIRGLHFYPFNNYKLPSIYTSGFIRKDVQIKARAKFKRSTLEKLEINNLRISMVEKSKFILSNGISSSHILKDHFDDGFDDFGLHLLNIIEDIDMVAEGFSRELLGDSLFDYSKNSGGYQVVTMIDQSPEESNKIVLSDSIDRLGLKKINIEWKVSDHDKQLTWNAISAFSTDSELIKLGRFRILKEREPRLWKSQLGFGHHHTGTTKMAFSEKKGVVNKNGKVFGTKNLFVTGSSIFPTGGHVPPTLTIVALTIRLAELLKNEE